MKKYPLLLAIIFSFLYIASTLFFYFTQRFAAFNFVYLMAMGAMIPFVILTIKLQRDNVLQGKISGRVAAREGMRFVLYSIFFLLLFQTIFYYSGWKEFKADALPQYIREQAIRLDQMNKRKFNEVELQKAIQEELKNITLFKELSFVFYRYIFVGIFASFISATFMKTTKFVN
jgi:Ca2+/Na+ antiporter